MTHPWVEPLLARERRILEEKLRHEHLVRRKQELETERRALHDEIDEAVRQLQALGRARVELGDLRRTSPISPVWGLDRGIPLDRYYIHRFLDQHREDIRGHVLEVKDSGYTRMFGDDRVTASDVLDIDTANPRATVVADLSHANALPEDTYDCFILTQTLGVIYDVAGALRHSFRILKPGGVLLCTLPAAGRISYEEGLDGDYWRFTEASVRRLFAEVFSPETFALDGHGNVLACTAFLYGLAPHELTPEELDAHDPYFPVVYTVRAVKGPAPVRDTRPTNSRASSTRKPTSSGLAGAVLMYHRVADIGHDRDRLTVSPDEFRKHMQHLHDRKYRVMPLADLVEASDAGTLGERAVSLTFDDGYLEVLTQAAPILAEWGFPATCFVVGGKRDGPHEYWWDTLERILITEESVPNRLDVDLPGGRVSVGTSNSRERLAAHDQVAEVLRYLNHPDRARALAVLVEWSGVQPSQRGARRPMTADEIRRLAEVPRMSIGAHTEHHLWLPAMSADEKREEVVAHKVRLESLLGQPVRSFAYPYGGYDEDTVTLVREAGFEVAVTTEELPVTPKRDRLRVPRFDAGGGLSAFAARLDRLSS